MESSVSKEQLTQLMRNRALSGAGISQGSGLQNHSVYGQPVSMGLGSPGSPGSPGANATEACVMAECQPEKKKRARKAKVAVPVEVMPVVVDPIIAAGKPKRVRKAKAPKALEVEVAAAPIAVVPVAAAAPSAGAKKPNAWMTLLNKVCADNKDKTRKECMTIASEINKKNKK